MNTLIEVKVNDITAKVEICYWTSRDIVVEANFLNS